MVEAVGDAGNRARNRIPWTVRIREALLASDPDHSRLRLAGRGMLTAALSLGLVREMAAWLHLPASAPMLATALSMMSSLTVNDPTITEQRKTFLVLPLPVLVCLSSGVLLSGHEILAVAGCILVVFLSIAAQRQGPRGMAAGFLSFNAYFFALFFRGQPADLPGLALGAVTGILTAYLVRFVLWRERPHRIIRRALLALPVRSRSVLDTLVPALREGETPWRTRKMRQALQELNQAALMVEDQLGVADPRSLPFPPAALRHRVFATEIAAGRIAVGVMGLVRDPEVPATVRLPLADALERAGQSLRGLAPTSTWKTVLQTAELAAAASPLVQLAVHRVGVALEELFTPPDDPQPGETQPLLPAPPPPVGPGLHPTTKQAIQAALACAIAVFVGRWIAPDRWFWAVLTAYLVIAPATTRGEIVVRAWRRTWGTVAGVLLGMGLATLVIGHPTVEIGFLFACIFFALYSMKRSYALMTLWFTALLAILYALLGLYSPHLMYVRFAETGAGAVIGALTALLVLPRRTGDRLRQALDRHFETIAITLERLAHNGNAVLQARELDRALAQVRQVAEPLTRSPLRAGEETLDLLQAVATLTFYIRQLTMPGLLGAAHRCSADLFVPALQELAARARWLQRANPEHPPEAPSTEVLQKLRASIERPCDPSQPREMDLALLWLERATSTLDRMAQDLGVGKD